jgi:hypothetical protein
MPMGGAPMGMGAPFGGGFNAFNRGGGMMGMRGGMPPNRGGRGGMGGPGMMGGPMGGMNMGNMPMGGMGMPGGGMMGMGGETHCAFTHLRAQFANKFRWIPKSTAFQPQLLPEPSVGWSGLGKSSWRKTRTSERVTHHSFIRVEKSRKVGTFGLTKASEAFI